MEGGGGLIIRGVIGINKLLEGGVIEFFQGEWGGVSKNKGCNESVKKCEVYMLQLMVTDSG